MVEPQVIDIKEVAKQNESFRKVLFTATKSQLVVMSLRPGEDIGTEVHQVDQLLYAVKGEGVAITGTRGRRSRRARSSASQRVRRITSSTPATNR